MNPPKMPIHIGDYKRDTGHLRAAGHGAYLLLMFHYWSTGSLPDDDDQLSAIACMTAREWKAHRPILEKFFKEAWTHKRIDGDLAAAKASYEKRAEAGHRGGKAKAEAKQSSSNATAGLELPYTLNLEPESKSSEPSGSGATAPDPRDIRADLFGSGLASLARMTGKTPDSCRSLVGKWLKSVDDEAIHVLGAIEDAERNHVADPVAWINRALQSHMGNGHGKRTVQDAAADLLDRVRSFDQMPAELRGGTGQAPVRLLPPRRCE